MIPMPKIRIDLNDPGSIDSALKYLDELKKNMSTVAQRSVEKLAQDAVEMADAQFAVAAYPGESDTVVSMKLENGGKTAKITATGSAVLFTEFGTGILKSDNPEERADITSGGSGLVQHGQYGKRHGSNIDGWFYKGSVGFNAPPDTKEVKPGTVHTFGNDANSCMYNTKKFVEKEKDKVVKGMFEKNL